MQIYKSRIGRKVISFGLLLTAFFAIQRHKEVYAKDFDIYGNTKIERRAQTETNLVFKNDNLSVGLNNVLTNGEKPENVFSSKLSINDGTSKLYLYLNPNKEETNLETKLNQKLWKSTNFDIGFGNNGVVHAGFEYGFLKPFGFGVGYLMNNGDKEMRFEIWKYWKPINLFTGVRSSNDKLQTIISMPSDNGFAVRYANISDFKGFSFNQLVFGISRAGYYGLNFGDSWFFLQDAQIHGSDPVSIKNNPLRYIVPPTAWLVKDFGGKLQYIKSKEGNTLQVEALKYLGESYWAGTNFESVSEGSTVIGLNFGKTSDKLKFVGGMDYDLENRNFSATLQRRLNF